MPGMPTDNITTEHLDQSTDQIQQARAEIYALAEKAKAIIAAFDQANGLAALGPDRKLPITRMTMGQGSGLDADKLRGKTDAAFAPSTHVGKGNAQHAVVTTGQNGFMSATDKTKLDTINLGAGMAALQGVLSHGGVIPLPAGYYEAQCKWMVSISNLNTGNATGVNWHCRTSARTVDSQATYYNNTTDQNETVNCTVNYLIVGIK